MRTLFDIALAALNLFAIALSIAALWRVERRRKDVLEKAARSLEAFAEKVRREDYRDGVLVERCAEIVRKGGF